MAKFLSTAQKGGSVAIAVCTRCNFKYHYTDLQRDPNTKAWVCKDCKDLYDPWRMPARRPDPLSLTHPRPDVSVNTADLDADLIGTESLFPLLFPGNIILGIETA